jgi:hypothetical protein
MYAGAVKQSGVGHSYPVLANVTPLQTDAEMEHACALWGRVTGTKAGCFYLSLALSSLPS